MFSICKLQKYYLQKIGKKIYYNYKIENKKALTFLKVLEEPFKISTSYERSQYYDKSLNYEHIYVLPTTQIYNS